MDLAGMKEKKKKTRGDEKKTRSRRRNVALWEYFFGAKPVRACAAGRSDLRPTRRRGGVGEKKREKEKGKKKTDEKKNARERWSKREPRAPKGPPPINIFVRAPDRRRRRRRRRSRLRATGARPFSRRPRPPAARPLTRVFAPSAHTTSSARPPARPRGRSTAAVFVFVVPYRRHKFRHLIARAVFVAAARSAYFPRSS